MPCMFPTAREARQCGSRGQKLILAEIRDLEVKMMEAMDNNKLEVKVTDSPFSGGTFGIDTVLYWNVAREEVEEPLVQFHLDTVRNHFTSLGYAITPKTNPLTGRSIQWHIQW